MKFPDASKSNMRGFALALLFMNLLLAALAYWDPVDFAANPQFHPQAYFHAFVVFSLFVLALAGTMLARGQIASESIWTQWVVLLLMFALLIQAFGFIYAMIGLKDGDAITHSTATGLYFSIVTWTTLGYGDIPPPPGLGRAVAATEALFGYLLSALLIALIVGTLQAARDQGRKGDHG